MATPLCPLLPRHLCFSREAGLWRAHAFMIAKQNTRVSLMAATNVAPRLKLRRSMTVTPKSPPASTSRYSSTQEAVRLLSSLGCPPTRHPHTRRGSLRLQGVSILRFVSIQGSTVLVTLAALLGLSSRSIGTTTLASRARGYSSAGMPCPALPGPRGWSSRMFETPLSSTVVGTERARRPWSRTNRLVELEGRLALAAVGKVLPGYADS